MAQTCKLSPSIALPASNTSLILNYLSFAPLSYSTCTPLTTPCRPKTLLRSLCPMDVQPRFISQPIRNHFSAGLAFSLLSQPQVRTPCTTRFNARCWPFLIPIGFLINSCLLNCRGALPTVLVRSTSTFFRRFYDFLESLAAQDLRRFDSF